MELMGIDRRYESNIDGLVRVPAKDQLGLNVDPSYVITGNFPGDIISLAFAANLSPISKTFGRRLSLITTGKLPVIT